MLNIDVVLTNNADGYPDYQPVSVAYSVDSDFGTIGPLPAGTYTVTSNVRGGTFECGPRETTLTVLPQPAPVVTATVVEFYHQALDHYFISQDANEIRDLESGVHAGWARTGESFRAYVAKSSDERGRRVCRWYGLPAAGLDTHVFTASTVECSAIATDPLTVGKWQAETFDAFEIPLPNTLTGVCAADTVPVYRLWNGRADSNHRYTTSLATKQAMLAKGYIAEGFGPDAVGMCALK